MSDRILCFDFAFIYLLKDSECSRGNSPNTGGKNENDKNKDRHFYNNQQIYHYPNKKTFKTTFHGMAIERFYSLMYCKVTVANFKQPVI